MSPRGAAIVHSHQEKRKWNIDSESTSQPAQPTAKRQKQARQSRHKTPPSFYDNLSRQWLTRRTLREFDRRTKPPLPQRQPSHTPQISYRFSELKRFARLGGPGLEDLRSYPEPQQTQRSSRTMTSSQRSASQKSSSRANRANPPDGSSITSFTKDSGRRTSAYDPAFEQHLRDHGIHTSEFESLDEDGTEYPKNLEDINARLAVPRPSLSPSRFGASDFRRFVKANYNAKNEKGVMSEPFLLISGNPDIPHQKDIEFNNIAPLTDGSIVKAKPDFYDGVRPADVLPRVRKELTASIEPSTDTTRPCLPNFFVEGKGPSGTAKIAQIQACYDGALGARGMHELRSFVKPDTALDNNAYTITSTYCGGAGSGMLTLYTTHPTASEQPGREVDYRMTQVNGFHMAANLETFRQGATAFRNARDWAKEQREAAVAAANANVMTSTLMPSQISTTEVSQSSSLPNENSDTSTDELAADTPIQLSFSSNTSSQRTGQGERGGLSSKQRRLKKEMVRMSKKRSDT